MKVHSNNKATMRNSLVPTSQKTSFWWPWKYEWPAIFLPFESFMSMQFNTKEDNKKKESLLVASKNAHIIRCVIKGNATFFLVHTISEMVWRYMWWVALWLQISALLFLVRDWFSGLRMPPKHGLHVAPVWGYPPLDMMPPLMDSLKHLTSFFHFFF